MIKTSADYSADAQQDFLNCINFKLRIWFWKSYHLCIRFDWWCENSSL